MNTKRCFVASFVGLSEASPSFQLEGLAKHLDPHVRSTLHTSLAIQQHNCREKENLLLASEDTHTDRSTLTDDDDANHVEVHFAHPCHVAPVRHGPGRPAAVQLYQQCAIFA